MCDCCESQNNHDSGFAFGLVIGAVIGAVVAVIIYKNRQTDVFQNLQHKLTGYFSSYTKSPSTPTKKRPVSSKLPVVLPEKIAKATTPTKVVVPKAKKFVKPKK